mgnify:CR=1 FL=1
MNSPISGLHHVTAIASDPQTNVDFYAGVLGLRLVKKTLNQDDGIAHPPWPCALPGGAGQAAATASNSSRETMRGAV